MAVYRVVVDDENLADLNDALTWLKFMAVCSWDCGRVSKYSHDEINRAYGKLMALKAAFKHDIAHPEEAEALL